MPHSKGHSGVQSSTDVLLIDRNYLTMCDIGCRFVRGYYSRRLPSLQLHVS